MDDDLESLRNYRRRAVRAKSVSDSRDFGMRFLGEIWSALGLPFGRWIWAVGEKLPPK
jgi:hypothetical protein